MNSSLLAALGPADATWAVLQANGRTTRYLRSGRGSAVLLLMRNHEEAGDWPTVVAHLAQSHRILIPEIQWPSRELGVWIGGFLDGIGAAPVTIIATDDLCMPALQVALSSPDRVSRLALSPEPVVEQDVIASHLSVHAEHASTPLLMLDANASSAQTILALDRFLA